MHGIVLDDAQSAALRRRKDAGQRMADALNAHVVFSKGCFGRWMAIRLEDGSSDGTLYDTREDAIRHQRFEHQAWYELVKPRSYSADECALTLMYARAAYDAGWRPADSPAFIAPVRIEDRALKIRQLRSARKR